MEKAIERQKNLDEASAGDGDKTALDVEAGGRFEWDDRYIDIIPDKDRKGLDVYFYRNGKNTAEVGLTLRAAVILMSGLKKILDEKFRQQIDELIKEMEG